MTRKEIKAARIERDAFIFNVWEKAGKPSLIALTKMLEKKGISITEGGVGRVLTRHMKRIGYGPYKKKK